MCKQNNPLIPRSDKHQISPYNISTPEANKVMRIETIINSLICQGTVILTYAKELFYSWE